MRFKLFILRLFGIVPGHQIIPIRDHWIFIDDYQNIWRINYHPEYYYGTPPFTIELIER